MVKYLIYIGRCIIEDNKLINIIMTRRGLECFKFHINYIHIPHDYY